MLGDDSIIFFDQETEAADRIRTTFPHPFVRRTVERIVATRSTAGIIGTHACLSRIANRVRTPNEDQSIGHGRIRAQENHFSVKKGNILVRIMDWLRSIGRGASFRRMGRPRHERAEKAQGGIRMSSVGSLTLWIHHLRSSDCRQRDEAARVIWERFSSRLQVLVRRHLDHAIRRREDEEDILQSMYASFCAGQLKGMTPPASREELWKLLVRITMCKVVNTAHRHRAARRDVRREGADPWDHPAGDRLFPRWMLEHVDRAQPSAEEKVIVFDELNRQLQCLPEDLRQIVIWKLEGFTNAEIACQIGRTVRCVELKMQLIRKRIEIGLEAGGMPSPNSSVE